MTAIGQKMFMIRDYNRTKLVFVLWERHDKTDFWTLTFDLSDNIGFWLPGEFCWLKQHKKDKNICYHKHEEETFNDVSFTLFHGTDKVMKTKLFWFCLWLHCPPHPQPYIS